VSNLPSRTSLENQIGAINLNSSTNSNTSNLVTGDGLPPLRYNRGVTFRPMTFHRSVGRHVRLELSSTIGRRHEEEFAQGYVFSSHNVTLGDRIVLQVLGTEDGYIGSIAFGLTNCDPSSIDVQNLPEDSDLLLDRAEYWVVSKDVASCPSVGDELSFQINRDGSVEFSKNGNIPSVFMHVDTSLPLWAFWDIYGHTLKIRLIGSTTEPVPRFEQATNYQPSVNSSTLNSPDSGIEPSMQQHQPLSECTICFEKGKKQFFSI
jgi:protein neuralized